MVQSSTSNPQVESSSKDIEGYKIKIYSWNSEGSKIDKTSWQQLKDGESKPSTPDFLVDISKELQAEVPSLVAFCSQRSVKPGDYLHSHALPSMMESLEPQYALLKRFKSMGTGGSGKALKTLLKGEVLSYGLRTSIYVLKQNLESIRAEEKRLKDQEWYDNSVHSCGYGVSLTRDGLAVYVKVPSMPVICFINCYIQSNKDILRRVLTTGDYTEREKELEAHNSCFNDIIGNLAGGTAEFPTGYAFVSGDLGYRVRPASNTQIGIEEWIRTIFGTKSRGSGISNVEQSTREEAIAILLSRDELRTAASTGKIISLGEGGTDAVIKTKLVPTDKAFNIKTDTGKPVEIKGLKPGKVTETKSITFLPTCPFISKRKTSISKNGVVEVSGAYNSNRNEGMYYPSWCNRILYLTSANYYGGIKCTQYGPFEYGNMKHWTQTGIEGSYSLDSRPQSQRA